MSQQDRVRQPVDAYNARDFKAAEALLHPREWTEAFEGYEVEITAMVRSTTA